MSPPLPADREPPRQPRPANIRDTLRAAKPNASRNAEVLDHISSPPPVDGNAQSPSPISKQLLHTIFDFLEPSAASQPASNFIFIENHYENHFLYALVLPLIARLLAVSSPGLLCVVQLPRPHILPPWATSPSVEAHQSNISNVSAHSKTPQRNTSSPTENTADTSKTDEPQPPDRKSDSPDGHPQTVDLIRRANAVLADSETPRTTSENIDAQLQQTGDQSPPPDPLFHDHQALRLVCNGFEVLTGKMPPPKTQVGSFTLASVAWEKAAIISPQDPSKAVSMSFSNGMNTPTDGVVVTYSNGSMVMLTLLDPYTMLESMTLSDATPVVVFSFAPAVGHLCMRQLLSIKSPIMSPAAGSVKDLCEKPNVLVVEIGHSLTPNSSVTDGITENEQARRSDDELDVNNGAMRNGRSRNLNGGRRAGHHGSPPCQNCPPVRIDAVPRSVPLFVNTISQAFIDPTHHDLSGDIYDEEENGMDNAPLNNGEGAFSGRHQMFEQETTPSHCHANALKECKDGRGKSVPSGPGEQANQHSSDGAAHGSSVPVSNGAGHHLYPPYQYAHAHYSYNANARYQHHVQDNRSNVAPPTFRANPEGHPLHINHHPYYMHGRPGTNFQSQYHTHHAMPFNPHVGHHPTYAPNAYYHQSPSVLPQTGMPSPRSNPSEWHRTAKPPHPPYAGAEPNPSDARRDMPANFSSHSAIALRARRKSWHSRVSDE